MTQPNASPPGPSPRIEDYALVGDCETAALVSRSGSVDWLCWPRFDGPACFAALLGSPENGRWSISPRDADARVARRYRGGTMVLETRFETATGSAILIDFMPPRDDAANLVRLVVGETGEVAFDLDLAIRFDYGRIVPWVSRGGDGSLVAIAGPDLLTLRTPVELHGEDLHTVGRFTVRAGQRVPFVLTHSSSVAPPPAVVDPEEALARTEATWRAFSGVCRPVGDWSEAVGRSVLTLKALTYAPTGAIVAAPTTSLPEWIGGSRNWDYRYCWLRDASFTLLSLMRLGYVGEAEAWRDWLMRAVAGSPEQMQIMYGIGGERRLPEWEVPWLPGFAGSAPVRVGNGAADQLQIDVYGQVADMLYQAQRAGLPPHPRAGAIGGVILGHLSRIWREPDEGIWEVRSGRQHFTYSKVMAWTAFDRAARLAVQNGDGAAAARWRREADAVHADVCAHAFDPALNSFVQAYGSRALDASLLLLPLEGFLPIDDPRVAGTIAAVEANLMPDGLVLRYDTDEAEDGLAGHEGAFLICSFWLVQAWVMQGRVSEARGLFERLLSLRNDVGLLAEQYDAGSRRQLGNFPQAFSHIGLINAALALERAGAPAEG
ncbi:MAG TPA: glycoside hydrolase family 15 protein [Salinarimonas sp.]|nr:glycoside hydrolase family 15 protein [Salinarimonas sp.]